MTEQGHFGIDDLRDRIGQKVLFQGADAVTLNDIRRKLEIYCFSCPLHDDDATAKASGYLGVVAPVTMTPLWGLPGYWSPGQPCPYVVDGQEMTGSFTDTLALPFARSVNASSEWRYHAALHIGDRLHGTMTVTSIEQRRTRVGTGIFLQYDSEYVKQSGELVALNRNTVFNYDPIDIPTPQSEADARAPVRHDKSVSSQESTASTDLVVDWNASLKFDDVAVGSDVTGPTMALTYQRIVMNIAADRMFSSIHHNTSAARGAGLNDIIFNTRGLETFLEIGLRRWMGLRGRLVRLGPFKMTLPVYPGDVVQTRWTVTSKRARSTGGEVDLEFCVLAKDRRAVQGVAVVDLPG